MVDPDRAAAFPLPFPKGILLTGVPRCGKSPGAKAVAREWQLPLLRLDPGLLSNKYVGDSEKNFRQALATAERMAPIVLSIDELEKRRRDPASARGVARQRRPGNRHPRGPRSERPLPDEAHGFPHAVPAALLDA